MFVTVKKRTLWIITLAVKFLCIIVTASVAIATNVNSYKPTVVIDAGHGGIDGGVSGTNTGVKESEINLAVTLMLKERLSKEGFNVVLTRSDSHGAGGADASKKEDMRKRKEIIESKKPDLVISIHCNKYPASAERRGAQAFFNANNPKSVNLAKAVQSSLNSVNKGTVGRDFTALKGDYYILNCTGAPSVIVECGFLSNGEDEKLLISDSYKEVLVDAVVKGVYAYLSEYEK